LPELAAICTAEGLGYTLMVEFKLEEGQIIMPSLSEFPIPTSLNRVPTKVILLESATGSGRFGAMSIGKPSLTLAIGAMANAGADAIGPRIHALPLTPERMIGGHQRHWGSAGRESRMIYPAATAGDKREHKQSASLPIGESLATDTGSFRIEAIQTGRSAGLTTRLEREAARAGWPSRHYPGGCCNCGANPRREAAGEVTKPPDWRESCRRRF
jgi:hypothetical protein